MGVKLFPAPVAVEGDLSASSLVGRGSAGGTGDPEQITLGSNLYMSGTTLIASSPQGTVSSNATGITTTQSSSSSVWTTITGSDVPVAAGNTYHIRWRLRTYSAASTTGLALQRVLSGGAAGTVIGFHYQGASNATNATSQTSREGTVDAFIGSGNSTSSTGSSAFYEAGCVFECSTDGTLSLQMQSEVDTSQVTVDGDGSYVLYEWWPAPTVAATVAVYDAGGTLTGYSYSNDPNGVKFSGVSTFESGDLWGLAEAVSGVTVVPLAGGSFTASGSTGDYLLKWVFKDVSTGQLYYGAHNFTIS